MSDWRSSGVSIHVLRIAVFASDEDWARPEACGGRRRHFCPRSRACVVSAGPNIRTHTYPWPFANADASPFADAGSDSNRDQFRFVGRCGRDEPRQQLSGAARKPGNERIWGWITSQSGRWRRFGGDGRTALSDVGEAYGISARNGAQANFVGDQRQTWGGVAGIGARIAPGVNVGFSVDQSRTTIDRPRAYRTQLLLERGPEPDRSEGLARIYPRLNRRVSGDRRSQSGNGDRGNARAFTDSVRRGDRTITGLSIRRFWICPPMASLSTTSRRI